ncbi:MAG: GTPase Era [Candidatus Poribacteria bacterium]
MENPKKFKSGYVSIIGEPNVGKSTLLNAMMGEKLAIVTPKPQTTRNQITGIVTTEVYQIIFVDTPGVLKPRYRLHNEMVKAAYRAIRDADVVIYMIDVQQPTPLLEESILDKIQTARQKTILAINKIDQISSLALLPIITEYSEKFPFTEILPISAKTKDGVSKLLDLIVAYLPEGPRYFPEDQISDKPERFFIAETIREKLFINAQQEIPYASSIVVEEFKERSNGITYIRALIYAERESQKRILIGERGKMIKRIGRLARMEIEQFLNSRVFLDLHVSVKADWRRHPRKLKDMGYG